MLVSGLGRTPLDYHVSPAVGELSSHFYTSVIDMIRHDHHDQIILTRHDMSTCVTHTKGLKKKHVKIA